MRLLSLIVTISLLLACQSETTSNLDDYSSTGYQTIKSQKKKLTDIDSTLLLTKQALGKAKNEDNSEAIVKSMIALGRLYFLKGEFDHANKHLISALSLVDASYDLSLKGEVNNLLGKVYQYSERYGLAQGYYRAALQTYGELNDESGLAETFGNIGHLMEKSGKYDSAIYYQKSAERVFLSLGDSTGLAHIYDNIGSIYEDLNDFDLAFEYFQKAYKINSQIEDEIESLINLNNIGDILRKTGDYERALEVAKEVIARAKANHQPYQTRSGYRDLSKLYQLTDKHELAYIYLDSCYEINREIYNKNIADEIAKTRAVYEVEQKEQQIALLEKDKQIDKFLKIAFSIVAVLLLGIGMLVYFQMRMRIRKNKEIFNAERELAMANEDRLKTELNLKELQEQKLHQELDIKSRELTTNALHIIQKNEFLEDLVAQLKSLKKSEDEKLNKKLKKIIRSIDHNFNLDDDWQEFETIFQQVHAEFFEQLRITFPDLTSVEIRLCAMLRLNLDSKDIATIMGISRDSLRTSRYRLRKKLGVDKGSNLYSFIMNIG